MVLKGQGFTRVYTLLEGLDAWKDEVLFPVVPQSPHARAAGALRAGGAGREVLRRRSRARRAAPGAEPMALPPQAAMPAVAPPTLPGGAGPGPKKKREGC